MFLWARGTLGNSVRESIIPAAAIGVFQLIAWFPRFGPARRHYQRRLKEEGEVPGGESPTTPP